MLRYRIFVFSRTYFARHPGVGINKQFCLSRLEVGLILWDYIFHILRRQQDAPIRCSNKKFQQDVPSVLCRWSAGALPECSSCSWVEAWQYAAAVAAGLKLVGMLQKKIRTYAKCLGVRILGIMFASPDVMGTHRVIRGIVYPVSEYLNLADFHCFNGGQNRL